MAATADMVRTKMALSETDWPDSILQGSLFLEVAVIWRDDRLSAADLDAYDDLTASQKTVLDNAVVSWVCHKVCLTEMARCQQSGSELKAGPVTIRGLSADGWKKRSEDFWSEVKQWLGLVGAAAETDAFGFEFTGGDFDEREEGDYYTIPDSLVMLTGASAKVEDP